MYYSHMSQRHVWFTYETWDTIQQGRLLSVWAHKKPYINWGFWHRVKPWMRLALNVFSITSWWHELPPHKNVRIITAVPQKATGPTYLLCTGAGRRFSTGEWLGRTFNKVFLDKVWCQLEFINLATRSFTALLHRYLHVGDGVGRGWGHVQRQFEKKNITPLSLLVFFVCHNYM